MPDMCMCSQKDNICPKRKKCYRYTAIPDEYWQSYSDFWNEEGDACHYYEETYEHIRSTKSQKR